MRASWGFIQIELQVLLEYSENYVKQESDIYSWILEIEKGQYEVLTKEMGIKYTTEQENVDKSQSLGRPFNDRGKYVD